MVQRGEGSVRFWQHHFDGLDASAFPTVTSSTRAPRQDGLLEHEIIHMTWQAQQKWSNVAICRAALAVLLARYTHAPEALFGIVVTHLDPDSKNQRAKPAQAVVPTRVLCAPHQSCSHLLQHVTAHDATVSQLDRAGLDDIRNAGEYASAACGFQTVLEVVTIQYALQASSNELHHRGISTSDAFNLCTDRALFLECQMADDSAFIRARYDQSLIDARQMTRFLGQLGCLIKTFLGSGADVPIGQLQPPTQEDQAEIHDWNSAELESSDVCVHDVIAERSASRPGSTAVFAWDGEWTYEELNNLSSRLAAHIQSLGLNHEQTVPICFEKSKWVVVGILAVLKAGLAFTLIEPSHPPARIAQICQQTSATIALVSKMQYNTLQNLVSHCVIVDDELSQSLSAYQDGFISVAKPQNLAYIIFTSGSTGDPKGCMIDHRGFASCALKYAPELHISSKSRSLQFASYAFGACLIEIVATLMQGGCVCIPSEEDRMNNITDFINSAGVTWALLTPSFIGAIRPENIPRLQTLVLGGEALSAEIRDTWASQVQLLCGYGQSETSSICSVARIDPGMADPSNIGRATGARLWITDPDNPDQLAPIGCIGELVVESPGVARGYIVPPPQTKSPFIAGTPSWHPTSRYIDRFSFYRTGDLVRYKSDGTIVYLGRRDLQVKIRGQRVDIGDVETHLRQQLPNDVVAVVEAVQRPSTSHNTILVAFLVGLNQNGEDNTVSATRASILEPSVARNITAKLQQLIPQYGIPSYYILLKRVPTTATGKTDRRKLRSIGAELLDEMTQNTTSKEETPTDSPISREDTLRQLWFRNLNIDPKSHIQAANFFDLGGDSIAAIKMANMARSAGIELSVADIIRYPDLSNLVSKVSVQLCLDLDGIEPIANRSLTLGTGDCSPLPLCAAHDKAKPPPPKHEPRRNFYKRLWGRRSKETPNELDK
ncbi:bassianolide synthetase, partial [Metarhizium majus ARSEF 297]